MADRDGFNAATAEQPKRFDPVTAGKSLATITADEWKKVEAEFRLWSFRVYYNKSYATEISPTLRFAKALVASVQPICDRNAVLRWYRRQCRKLHEVNNGSDL